MPAKRRYSDEERAEALAALDANGGNLSRTARQTGVPRITLRQWAQGRVAPGVSVLRQVKKADLAQRMEDLAHALLDDLARPNRLASASVQQAATALGIAVDKMRLLRNEPTSITGQGTGADEKALSEEIDAIKRRIAELLAGTGILPFQAPAAPGAAAGATGEKAG
jgi:transposase-like protein